MKWPIPAFNLLLTHDKESGREGEAEGKSCCDGGGRGVATERGGGGEARDKGKDARRRRDRIKWRERYTRGGERGKRRGWSKKKKQEDEGERKGCVGTESSAESTNNDD